jgi:hypothetical protein
MQHAGLGHVVQGAVDAGSIDGTSSRAFRKNAGDWNNEGTNIMDVG